MNADPRIVRLIMELRQNGVSDTRVLISGVVAQGLGS